eukprot:gene25782-biopygen15061
MVAPHGVARDIPMRRGKWLPGHDSRVGSGDWARIAGGTNCSTRFEVMSAAPRGPQARGRRPGRAPPPSTTWHSARVDKGGDSARSLARVARVTSRGSHWSSRARRGGHNRRRRGDGRNNRRRAAGTAATPHDPSLEPCLTCMLEAPYSASGKGYPPPRHRTERGSGRLRGQTRGRGGGLGDEIGNDSENNAAPQASLGAKKKTAVPPYSTIPVVTHYFGRGIATDALAAGAALLRARPPLHHRRAGAGCGATLAAVQLRWRGLVRCGQRAQPQGGAASSAESHPRGCPCWAEGRGTWDQYFIVGATSCSQMRSLPHPPLRGERENSAEGVGGNLRMDLQNPEVNSRQWPPRTLDVALRLAAGAARLISWSPHHHRRAGADRAPRRLQGNGDGARFGYGGVQDAAGSRHGSATVCVMKVAGSKFVARCQSWHVERGVGCSVRCILYCPLRMGRRWMFGIPTQQTRSPEQYVCGITGAIAAVTTSVAERLRRPGVVVTASCRVPFLGAAHYAQVQCAQQQQWRRTRGYILNEYDDLCSGYLASNPPTGGRVQCPTKRLPLPRRRPRDWWAHWSPCRSGGARPRSLRRLWGTGCRGRTSGTSGIPTTSGTPRARVHPLADEDGCRALNLVLPPRMVRRWVPYSSPTHIRPAARRSGDAARSMLAAVLCVRLYEAVQSSTEQNGQQRSITEYHGVARRTERHGVPGRIPRSYGWVREGRTGGHPEAHLVDYPRVSGSSWGTAVPGRSLPSPPGREHRGLPPPPPRPY